MASGVEYVPLSVYCVLCTVYCCIAWRVGFMVGSAYMWCGTFLLPLLLRLLFATLPTFLVVLDSSLGGWLREYKLLLALPPPPPAPSIYLTGHIFRFL